MSKAQQFGLCLLFFLLVRRPEPAVVSPPLEAFTDTTRTVLTTVNAVELEMEKPVDE